MKNFKDIPSNKRYVEGSIVESCLVSESVKYAMEYMPKSHNESFEVVDDGECPQRCLEGKIVKLTTTQFVQIMAFQRSQPSASLPTLSPTGVVHPNASQEPEQGLSQPTASEDHELQPKEKLLVLISREGEAIGPNAAKFSSRAGHYIKVKIPVFYPDWKTVKKTFKDAVWNKLMGEFKFNIPYPAARKFLEKGFPAKWRVIKSRFRNNILKKCATNEEALELCPTGVQQVKLANERKIRSSLTEEGMEYYEDMDTDALAEVLGPEKRTRTRGDSSHASNKQLEYAAIGKILFQQASSSNSKLEAQMNSVQSQMDKMNDVMMAFINRASGNSPTYAQLPPMTNTPQGEVGSSSVHRPSQQIPQNLMNHFEPASFESRMMMATTDDATWKEREATVLALGVEDEALDTTKTVIWNGPMGVFEFEKFAAGTEDWFEQYSERVTDAEQMILTTLNFELTVQHPYAPLTSILTKVGLSQSVLVNLALCLVSEGSCCSSCIIQENEKACSRQVTCSGSTQGVFPSYFKFRWEKGEVNSAQDANLVRLTSGFHSSSDKRGWLLNPVNAAHDAGISGCKGRD
ncbi:cyclin-T1-5-like isoform X2 [Thalictrum thalictroides]|uniref:phosphoglycerate kinase n=1 Tax=Thalictrum thalictroides TaxID=46969 RepID=A0A7J6XAH0_THATH|nr:cyclin-T1-5-like isoform X2 [Thalictrum thalictroides]